MRRRVVGGAKPKKQPKSSKRRATVVSFINYKGGVGKTTTTYHVGCSLVQHWNKRVLLIDIDPQTNLTFLCAPYERWVKQKKKVGTIADMYQRYTKGHPIDTKRYRWQRPIRVRQQPLSGLDLIPCDIDLLGEDLAGLHQLTGHLPGLQAMRKQADAFLKERMFLAKLIREVDDEYDYVLIDCPPNLYLMTQNALSASDHYVVTAIPDHLSTIGLRILRDKVGKIGELLKSAAVFSSLKDPPTEPNFGGVIFVKVRIGGQMITNTHAAKIAEVRALLGDEFCFRQRTTELIGYGEAAENSLPVWNYGSDNARRATNKNEYPEITREFLQRF